MSSQRNRDAKFPWRGSFSTISDERTTTVASDEFATLDECRSWATDEAESRKLAAGKWTFECGNDCTWKDDTIVGGKRIKTYACNEVIAE